MLNRLEFRWLIQVNARFGLNYSRATLEGLSSQYLMQGDPQTLEIKKRQRAVVKLVQNIINYSNKTSYNSRNNSSP
jgi:hypothetical protein